MGTGVFKMVNDEKVEMTEEELEEFRNSLPPDETEPEKSYTWIEFMDLFTMDEQLAIAGAAMSDVHVKLWYDKAVGAQGILLNDQRTIEGIHLMVSKNLLSQERADQILSDDTSGTPN